VKIADVLAKVTAGTDLSDEEKTFLESYKEPDGAAELAKVNAAAKRDRLKMEAKIAEMQTALEEAQESAESSQAGDELAKLQRANEKLTAKLEKAQADLTAANEQHAKDMRTHAMSGMQLKWLDGVSDKYKSAVLEEAFEGIDTDDLADASVTGPILEKIAADNANFIDSGASGGAGTGAGEQGKQPEVGTENVWTRAKIAAISGTPEWEKHKDAVFKALAAGEITE